MDPGQEVMEMMIPASKVGLIIGKPSMFVWLTCVRMNDCVTMPYYNYMCV